ncbi:MAG: porin [Elusimicrobia bacterium]|nr:porin [Elusimicrobiota bacterium]
MRKLLIAAFILCSVFARAEDGKSEISLISSLPDLNFGVYGVIDTGYRYSYRNAEDTVGGRLGLDSGLQRTSRIGFTAEAGVWEDFKAGAVLERGLSTDTGTEPGGWNRQAFLYISNPEYGKIAFGKQLSSTYILDTKFDPFNHNSDAGLNAVNKYIQRTDNTTAYYSPEWGGFSFMSGFSLNIDGDENPGGTGDKNLFFVTPQFTRGNFSSAVNMLYYRYKNPASGGTENLEAADFFALYDFGIFKLTGYYGFKRAPDGDFVLYGSEGKDTQEFMIGATVPVSKKSFFLGTYKRRVTEVYAGGPDAAVGELSVGYNYRPIKDFLIYLVWSNIVNNSAARESMLNGGVLGSDICGYKYQSSIMAGAAFAFDLDIHVKQQ